MKKQCKLVQGNAAIAQGAFYAGARYYAGYPITPSSEIAEIASRELPRLGGVFMQMEDELASMGAIVGASLTGRQGLYGHQRPRLFAYAGKPGHGHGGRGAVVVVNVQRSGPSTGLATKPAQSDIMQLRWGRHGDQEIIALAPSSVQECFELTVKAFNLSEKYRVPVIMAPEEVAAHMRENLTIPEPGELEVIERTAPACAPEEYKPFCFDEGAVAPLASYGSRYVFHVTSSMHGENGYSCNTPENAARRVAQLHTKLARGRKDIVMTRYFGPEDCATLIVTSGVVTRAARSAARAANAAGDKVGVLQLQTLWPFADAEVREAAHKAGRVVVAEMNYAGQLAGEVKKCVPDPSLVVGVNTYNGGIMTPSQIAAALL